MEKTGITNSLQTLRRDLIWNKLEVGDYFHATVDKQVVRDAVYSELMKHPFKIQATVVEKCKAQPQVRESKARFYKYPWFYHFKHGIGPHIPDDAKLMVTAASIGSKKEKLTFVTQLEDVMSQTVRRVPCAVDFRPALADPCLQVADYCAWAIQRKWEIGDSRSYDLLKDRITYEYDLWKNGTTTYY